MRNSADDGSLGGGFGAGYPGGGGGIGGHCGGGGGGGGYAGGGGGWELTSLLLVASEPKSGFSMSMYACMSVMADSDAPEAQTRSTISVSFIAFVIDL